MDDITDALDAERQVFDTEFTELRRGVLQRIDVMAEDLRAFPPMPMREKIDTARRWIADEFDATFDRILVSGLRRDAEASLGNQAPAVLRGLADRLEARLEEQEG